MKLTEAEMRMVFQIESTNQNAALNEIYMTWRYAPNPATKETAEGLLDKLRPLSDQPVTVSTIFPMIESTLSSVPRSRAIRF